MSGAPEETAVRAAGGVVVRLVDGEPRVAVIHRPKYDDWSLPKGKLDPGEGWEQAALREVREETGWRCEIERELAPGHYRDGDGRPKFVRFWLMRAVEGEFAPNDEVDALRWLAPAEALAALEYEHDRELVRSASNERPG